MSLQTLGAEATIRSKDFSQRFHLLSVMMVLALPVSLLHAQRRSGGELNPLKAIEVNEPDGQILSYRHLAGTTEVQMRGTQLAPQASIRVKVSTRPGFVKLDIRRGSISGLQPANRLGKDFLTYVLWSVSVDGRASNLAEITFKGDQPVSVGVTTTYQTFWLMVTAEPYYAVVEPSPRVVLYSAGQSRKEMKKKKAVTVGGDLFYFTHYTSYDEAAGAAMEATPNELLQARKAVDLASRSGILASDRRRTQGVEEEYTRQALTQSRGFLAQAEETYKRDPGNSDVIQLARTAAQTAEDARSLSMDEARDLSVRQVQTLEKEVAKLQNIPAEDAKDIVPEPASLPLEKTEPPANEQSEAKIKPAPSGFVRIASQPALWFALLGWGVAVALLFRRRFI